MSIRGVPFQFRVGPSDGQPPRPVPASMLGGAQTQPLDLSAAELDACSESLKKVRVRLVPNNKSPMRLATMRTPLTLTPRPSPELSTDA